MSRRCIAGVVFNSFARRYTTSLQETATQNIRKILQSSIQFNPSKHKLFVLYDAQCELSKLLSSVYANAMESNIKVMNFDEHEPNDIKTYINNELEEDDLVVCIQTGAFYLNDYRLRLELFARNIKNIEHVHLGLMTPEQYETYVNSLSFDHTSDSGSKLAYHLKERIENAKQITVTSGKPGSTKQLLYETAMETPLLNIGKIRRYEECWWYISSWRSVLRAERAYTH